MTRIYRERGGRKRPQPDQPRRETATRLELLDRWLKTRPGTEESVTLLRRINQC